MSDGRKQRLAVLLGVVAIGALVYQFWPSSSVAPAGSPVATGPGGRAAPAAAQGTDAPDVRLRDLGEEHPAPGNNTRNLFRFLSKPSPAPTRPVEARPPVPTGPPPPPPVPPIPLKFIGVAEKSSDSKKIAILSDARGTYWGREGEIVEGRYRILRIGVESIEMSYLDGRGRQVIRLTGS